MLSYEAVLNHTDSESEKRSFRLSNPVNVKDVIVFENKRFLVFSVTHCVVENKSIIEADWMG